MRFLSAILVFGLAAAAATAAQPAKDGKATVKVTGEFTADKDTTLNYTLKKGGKVVAEEKGLKSLPGKEVEVPAADAAGPFELTLSATGGALKVTKIGVTSSADGKKWEGTFGGRIGDLNAKDARGFTVRSVTFPVTLSPAQQKGPETPAGGGNAKNDSGKSTDKKKEGGGNAKNDGTKKSDDTKKKPDTTKKPDDKKTDDGKKIPVAPPPVPK